MKSDENEKSQLVEDLAQKKAKQVDEPSRLLIDLETKRKQNLLFLGVSQLVRDLNDKKRLTDMFIKAWKEADEVSKVEIESVVLEILGHPLDISKLVLDLEEKSNQ